MSRPWGGGSAAKIRRDFQARIDAGAEFICPFCRREISKGQLWDVDHATPRDVDPSATWDVDGLRPAHRRCNRRAGQRMTTRKRYRRSGPLMVVSGARGPRPAPVAPVARPAAMCAVCVSGRAVRDGLCAVCASAASAASG